MSKMLSPSLVCLTMLACALTGCGGSKGPPTARVSGKVTLNGKPLEKGVISFIPSDGNGATAGENIVNGAYSTTVPLGPKRVEIRAPQVTGTRKAYDTPDSPVIPIIKELIPLKYNAQSELTTTVDAKGGKGDFTLEGPPPP